MDHASQEQCLIVNSQQPMNLLMGKVTVCQIKDTLGIRFLSTVITSTFLRIKRMDHLQSQNWRFGKLYLSEI